MNDSTPTNDVDAGKAAMRAMIGTYGIGKAVATVADEYAAPANYVERDQLAGMILAAYEAGMVKGANL